jgi:hypothetical protein
LACFAGVALVGAAAACFAGVDSAGLAGVGDSVGVEVAADPVSLAATGGLRVAVDLAGAPVAVDLAR